MSKILRAAGTTALAFIPYVGPFLAIAASALNAQYDARVARRKARAAYNASLRDQSVTVMGGVNPRGIVYGRTVLGGQLIFAESHGPQKQYMTLVIALAHGEIDAIETVYFNDAPLTIDGANNVSSAPYFINYMNHEVAAAYVPTSAPYTVTLPSTPYAVLYVQLGLQTGWGGGDGGAPIILTAGVDYTVSGTTVSFDAAHSGQAVQIVWERAFTSSYAQIYRYTGGAGQDISGTMAALGVPSWTSADKCQGMALIIVRLLYGENVWPTGVPNIKCVVRGRKVYDPRSALTVWSANAALCTRDYLRFQYGVNAADAKMDDSGATNPSANICDEDVQLTSGPDTWQDRYTSNGLISTGNDRLSNLALFAQTLAGSVNYSQGKWRIRAGAYSAPSLTLTEATLASAGGIQIVPFSSRRDLINGATGTYLNADAGYIEDQFPEWSSATFITEDGGAALATSLQMPLVTDSARAQRLAKIAVYRAREALTLKCTCNFMAYTWQVGDMVSVTLARYGFSAKPFRVVDRGFSVEGGIKLTLREEPNGLYDWNLGEASILSGAGNTTLPNPAIVAAPVIVSIASAGYTRRAADGSIVARILVGITSPADEYVRKGGRLQLQYKRGDWSVSDWVDVFADGNAASIWIDPAFDGQNYLIRARAINNAGYSSAWTTAQVHTCIGRPGVVANLLQNADWTEDLGYPVSTSYSDTRALRGWSPGYSTFAPNFGRNYDGGKTWNIGRGGAWMLNSTTVNGQYMYIYQWVPVVAGVEYELQVRCGNHRQYAYIAVNWYNAAQDTGLGSIADGHDAGNTVDGDPYQNPPHRLHWCKGVAPANTAWALVHCLMQNTAATASPGYTFWQRAMFNVAPTGVTRETATAWDDGHPSNYRGLAYLQSVSANWTTYSSCALYGSAGAFHYAQDGGTGPSYLGLTFDVKAGDQLSILIEAFGNIGIGGGPYFWNAPSIIDVFYAGSGKTIMGFNAGNQTGNLERVDIPWTSRDGGDLLTLSRTRLFTCPTAGTVTIGACVGTNLGLAAGILWANLKVDRVLT